jgi:putative ABC transport system ATP-binding protein
MDLLRELHRAGATIVMVTHDPRFARYAQRTVTLFDGRIVNESFEQLEMGEQPSALEGA